MLEVVMRIERHVEHRGFGVAVDDAEPVVAEPFNAVRSDEELRELPVRPLHIVAQRQFRHDRADQAAHRFE